MYFYDLKDSTTYSTPINNEIQLKLERNDRVEVRITTMNEQVNAFLNTGTVGGGGGNLDGNVYIVNNDGAVNLPMIGAIKIVGLTKEEARSKIASELTKYVKDPVVNVEHRGIKYTVWGMGVTNGEVKYSETDKINIIEALVSVGDIKKGAELNNVMLIRQENGMRNMVRIDLGDSKLLNSPYFYLKQNDMIYVEPKKWLDGAEARNTQIIDISLRSLQSITTLLSTYVIFKNI